MGRLNDEIDGVAAEWAARMAGRELTPDEQDSFDSWIAADTRHLGAFARARTVLLRLGRLRAVGADALRSSVAEILTSTSAVSSSAQPAVTPPTAVNDAVLPLKKPVWTRRRAVMTGSVAACVAGLGILGFRWRVDYPDGEFSTRVGETRQVRLPDGSVVTLNTNSRLTVRYTDAVRKIRLEQGEALFKVAKNKKRPFIVAVSDTEVRAVGTAFTVRLLPQRPIQILVQEGVVEVARRGKEAGKPIRAVAETQTLVPADAPIVVHSISHPQVARKLAWQYGRIAMENETLKDAAAEFARYSDTRIIVDPAVSGRTITGLFASNDPVGFAKVAASVLDLHVEEEPNAVRIVH